MVVILPLIFLRFDSKPPDYETLPTAIITMLYTYISHPN